MLDGNSLRHRRAAATVGAAGDGVAHGRVGGGLNPGDADVRIQRPGGDGNPRNQPAAADGDDQVRQFWNRGQHLKPDRPLAGDDRRIIEGVDHGQAAFGDQGIDGRQRVFQRVADQHHVGAERLGLRHLAKGRQPRHHDGGGNAQPGSVVGDALCVIARGDGYDATLTGLLRQCGELVQGAPVLERSGVLKRLQLQHCGAAQPLRQRGSGDGRRGDDGSPQHFGRGANVVDGYGGHFAVLAVSG